MKDFRNRVTVVTGAASGIGRALASELAARGARLALADVNGAGLDARILDRLQRWMPGNYMKPISAVLRRFAPPPTTS